MNPSSASLSFTQYTLSQLHSLLWSAFILSLLADGSKEEEIFDGTITDDCFPRDDFDSDRTCNEKGSLSS